MREGKYPTTVAIHQPAYLPWLGYFDRIKKADIFVFLDTVQFEKGSFINRNRIKTPRGAEWLTIPVKMKGYTKSTLLHTEMNGLVWVRSHLDRVFLNYKYLSGFYEKYVRLCETYNKWETVSLSDFCYHQLVFWLKELNISTRVCRSRDIHTKLGKKSDLVLDICKYFGADYYLSGPFGRHYLDEESFRRENIKVLYHDFQHPVYPQLWGDFLPGMGIVDYWMNKED